MQRIGMIKFLQLLLALSRAESQTTMYKYKYKVEPDVTERPIQFGFQIEPIDTNLGLDGKNFLIGAPHANANGGGLYWLRVLSEFDREVREINLKCDGVTLGECLKTKQDREGNIHDYLTTNQMFGSVFKVGCSILKIRRPQSGLLIGAMRGPYSYR